MKKYHVAAGMFGIYAGILKNKKEWKDKSECTDEALEAVRDYLYDKCIETGEASGGYEWTRKDGAPIELRLTIKSDKDEHVQKLLNDVALPMECGLCDNGKNPEKVWGGARWAYNYCPNCGRKLEANY